MHHFSELDIWIVRGEIKKFLLGLKVGAFLGDGKHFLIRFRKGPALYVSLDFKDYRVHITKNISVYPLSPWRNENLLKGYILRDVKVPKGERVLYLLFSKGPSFPKKMDRILAIELTGKFTNLFLLDSGGKILDMARSLDPNKAKTRLLRPGMIYEQPPPRSLNLWKIKTEDAEYLKNHFEPFFIEWQNSGKPWKEWLEEFIEKADKECRGVLYLGENWIPIFYSPLPLISYENQRKNREKRLFDTFSETVENFYLSRAKEERKLKEEKVEEDRLREKLQKEIERLKVESTRLREYGEILLRHINEVKAGVNEVVLEGKRIPLDPKLTPGQNAERYFDIHKRYRRGIKKLEERLSEGIKPTPKEKEKVIEVTSKHTEEPYRVFESPGGFKVYVGKNAKGNEVITFKMASPMDIFFHVKDSPGAHVILKTGGREPQREDILFAATLALKYSKLARDGKGVVSFTEKKNIKRPPGAAKGLVILKEEKTIQVRI